MVWVGGFSEEEVDGLCGGIIFGWVTSCDGVIVGNDDVEADFFFDFAEGSFLIGFVWFLMTFWEAAEEIAVIVAGGDDKNSVVVDNNTAAAGFLVHRVIIAWKCDYNFLVVYRKIRLQKAHQVVLDYVGAGFLCH